MMKPIIHPLNLKGKIVELIPLETYHEDDLIHLSKDERIWQHYAVNGANTQTLQQSLIKAIAERNNGSQYPFVIKLLNNQKIIGSTRFLDVQPEHHKLEIGWTWLHPDYWKSSINTECKYLLLRYCFEMLSARRVQLKTDENNIRSRKAIEKIGGRFEGILRNDMIRENGSGRNSAYYSIIDTEWEVIKYKLESL